MNFMADYDDMQQIARDIHHEAENYMNDVKDLYNIVYGLEDVWEGNDNASYTEKVNSYREDIENLGKAVNNYAMFLDKAAVNLSETQSDIANAASRL